MAGKRVRKATETVEVGKLYNLSQAIDIVCKFPKAKFDEVLDIAIKLGVDPKQADENVRGTVALPHGTGKTIRVAAFCKGEKIAEARDAGADFVGAEDLISKVQGGWMDFDAAVATPDMMGQVGKIGKQLGPRGLMPNPKVGTVAIDIGKAVQAIKQGRVEYRVEKAGIVHTIAGKMSFGPDKLRDNVTSVIEAIVRAKPKASKGIYLQAIYLSPTMGPSVAVDPVPYRDI